jgi:cytoplasmic iron level regulating protein YaaA (DUF328/UPF0246 family)
MRIKLLKALKVLLVISCSKKKSTKLLTRKQKASDAYMGPMFQVIRKAKRDGRWSPHIHLGIVSAKYGFLRETDYIENYNLKMTKELASKHNQTVISQITKWHEEEQFDYIHVLMGKDYLKSVEGLKTYIDTKIHIENMGGLGLGQRKLVQFLNALSNKPKDLLDFISEG